MCTCISIRLMFSVREFAHPCAFPHSGFAMVNLHRGVHFAQGYTNGTGVCKFQAYLPILISGNKNMLNNICDNLISYCKFFLVSYFQQNGWIGRFAWNMHTPVPFAHTSLNYQHHCKPQVGKCTGVCKFPDWESEPYWYTDAHMCKGPGMCKVPTLDSITDIMLHNLSILIKF